MATSQATENTDNQQQDAPTETFASVAATIPDELRTDPYVQAIAAQCDYLRTSRDREREDHKAVIADERARLRSEQASHRETRDDHMKALTMGMDQAVELTQVRAKLAAAVATNDRSNAFRDALPYLLLVAVIVAITVMTVAGH